MIAYQPGTVGKGGEWHPAVEYTQVFATREAAQSAIDTICDDANVPQDVRGEYEIKQIDTNKSDVTYTVLA